MRDTLDLCMPTRPAISVTPNKGTSILKVSSTFSPLSSTDAPARPSGEPSVSLGLGEMVTLLAGPGRVIFVSMPGGVRPGADPGPAESATDLIASDPQNVVLGAERELGDVVRSVWADDQDVVFPVPTGAWLALGDGDHRFHGDDHAGFQHGVDVLPQFQAGLPAVVVAQHPEGVPVPEGAVGQQPLGVEDLVQFGGDLAAHRAGFDQLQPTFVDPDIDLPVAQRLRRRLPEEQGAFQGRVVAGD